jgi:hypothetical protein
MPRKPAHDFVDRWIEADEVAEILGMTVDMVRRDTVVGNLGLPRFQWGPKTVRYRLSEVVAWAEARRVMQPARASAREVERVE